MNFLQKKTRNMVLTALLFTMALILSFVEGQIPIPLPVPGIQLGLSNIAVMYSLFFVRKRQALTLVILKSLFAFLTRGAVASLLSLCGGLLSLAIMIVLLFLFRTRISYLLLSIAGAVFHNVGQLLAVSVIYTSIFVWAYFPVLLIAGIMVGSVTSVLLRVVMPALSRLNLHD